jgi:hypothetical protein
MPTGPRPTTYPLTVSQNTIAKTDDLQKSRFSVDLEVSGDLDVGALRSAKNALVAAHDALRMRVDRDTGGELVQWFAPTSDPELEVIEVTSDAEIERHRRAFASSSMQLATDGVIDFRLLRTARNSHVLLVRLHHLASDNWANAIWHPQLWELYDAIAGGAPVSDQVRPSSFEAYVRHELSLGTAIDAGQLSHWRTLIATTPFAAIPLEPGSTSRGRYETAALEVGGERFAVLDQGVRAWGVTLPQLVHGIVALLVGKVVDAPRFLLPVVDSGRHAPQWTALVGPLARAIFLPVEIDGDKSAGEFLQRISSNWLSSVARSQLPFKRSRVLAALDAEGVTPSSTSEGGVEVAPNCRIVVDTESLRPGHGLRLRRLEPLDIGRRHGPSRALLFSANIHARALDITVGGDPDILAAGVVTTLRDAFDTALRNLEAKGFEALVADVL